MSDLLLLHHLNVLYSEIRKVDKSIIYHPVKQYELNFTFSTLKKWYQSSHQAPDPFCLDQLNSTFDIHQKQKKNLSLLAMTHPRSFHVYTHNSLDIPQVDPIDTCIGMLRYLNYENHTTLSAHHVLMPFFQSLNSNSKITLIALRAIIEILPTLKDSDEFMYAIKITSRSATKLVPRGNEDVLGILQLLLDIFHLLLEYDMDSEQITWWISTLLGYIVGKLPDGLKLQAEQAVLSLVKHSWHSPQDLSHLLGMLLSPILPKSPFQVYFKGNKLKTVFFDYKQFTECNDKLTTPVQQESLLIETDGLQHYCISLCLELNMIFYLKHPLPLTLEKAKKWQDTLENDTYIEACLRLNGLRSMFRLLYHPSTTFQIRFHAFQSLCHIVFNNYQNPNLSSELYILLNFIIDAISLLGPTPTTLTHPRPIASKFKPTSKVSPNTTTSDPLPIITPFTVLEPQHQFPVNHPRQYPIWVAMQAMESGDHVRHWQYTQMLLQWYPALVSQTETNQTDNLNKLSTGLLPHLQYVQGPNEIPQLLFNRMWHSHGLLCNYFYKDEYDGPFQYVGHGICTIHQNRVQLVNPNGPFPPASFLKNFIITSTKESQSIPISDTPLSASYPLDPIGKIVDERIAVSNEVVEWRNALMEMIERISCHTDLLCHIGMQYDYNQQDNVLQRFICAISKYCMPDYSTICNRSFCSISLNAMLTLLHQLTLVNSCNPIEINHLRLQLQQQHLMKTCAQLFASDLKLGLKAFQEHNFLPKDLLGQSKDTASFLKQCKLLNKGKLGELLGKPSNVAILNEYCKCFDFTHCRIDEALREFLSGFRLPGESQQIERILEHFSTHYFSTTPRYITEQTGVLVLSYAIVMLNTDAHSPQVKNRMSVQQFRNNLRGTNKDENFDATFLNSIYEAITQNEIVMPGEKDNNSTFFLFYDQVSVQTVENQCEVDNLKQALFRDNWGLWLSILIHCILN